jgi:hypothetical protein
MTYIKKILPPKSTLRHAWFVVAPREFVIVALINMPIFLFFYRKADAVSIAGPAPLLNYFGPMFFFLPLLTTFFGFMNGIFARRAGIGPALLQGKTSWKLVAVVAGILWGIVCCPICFVVCLKLQDTFPDLYFSLWSGMFIIGLVSGIAGYILHGLAICCAAFIPGE